jgi:predicted MPP superfamily phosphohydrolase
LKFPSGRLPGTIFTAAVGTAAAVTTLRHTRYAAPYRPQLERVEVTAPPTARWLSGLRIGYFTDPHLGPMTTADDVERGLSLLFSGSPELLLLGGDLICESPRYGPEAAAILGRYARKAPLGAVSVLGNHDLSNDGGRLTRLLQEQDIRVLRNKALPVAYGGKELWIVGIDDALLGRPDPVAAFSAVPAGSPSLVLWHEPDWAEDATHPSAFVMLAGHSHGGQVRLPKLGAITTPNGGRRFVAGFNQANGLTIYTSRGSGMYRPPVRFNCAPEVTLITLV